MTVDVVLDEHVSRVFERVLRERGYLVENARDRFGERTSDEALLERSSADGFVLVTNNAKDFEPLHGRTGHCGLLVYRVSGFRTSIPRGSLERSTKSSDSTAPMG